LVRSTLVEQFTATAFAADLGVMVFPLPHFFKDRLILGAAVQNLGSKLKYKTSSDDLPRVNSAGATVRFWDRGPEYGSALFSVQAEQSLGEIARYRLGGEYSFGSGSDERQFALRAGYRIHVESENYSIGLGFREKNFELNYAFVNGAELENTHRFTLAIHFGKAVKLKVKKETLIELNKEMKPEEIEMIKEKKGQEKYYLIEREQKEKKNKENE
jgi:hypothetical protein